MRPPRKLVAAIVRRIFSPLIPPRRMLQFMLWVQAIGGECEPELLNLEAFCGSEGDAVDIGANVGWYTYRLSKRFKRVIAFEMNDEITGWIEQYNPGNIELVHVGLSSCTSVAKAYVPIAHGMKMTGWGSLYRDNLPGASEYLEKEVRLVRLDDFDLTGIGFVKIDVEGHEAEVLKGGAETIGRSRPVVLIEVKDKNLEFVNSWFEALRYRQFDLNDLVGKPGQAENYIYLPAELLPLNRIH